MTSYLPYYLLFGIGVCIVWFGLDQFKKSGPRTDQSDQTIRPVESPRPAVTSRHELDAVDRLKDFFGITERERKAAAVKAVDELHAGIHEISPTVKKKST